MGLRSSSRQFPGFDRVYVLYDPQRSAAYFGNFEADPDTMRGVTRGELHIDNPIGVYHKMGGSPKDIIWTSHGVPMIVSQRVIDVLTEAGISGWGTYPVRVLDRAGNEVEGYFGLQVTGRCGPIDPSRSEVIHRRFPGGIFPQLKGFYFDPASWDGSDVFVAEKEHHGIFVTERARIALQKARIRNVRFRAASSIEVDPMVLGQKL
jgi:hypothetical protein